MAALVASSSLMPSDWSVAAVSFLAFLFGALVAALSGLLDVFSCVCGKIQERSKGKSGIPCVNSGIYCGVMWVIEELSLE